MKKLIDKLIKKKPFIFLDQIIYRFIDHLVIGSAAELTYFLVLSIFPFLIALLNIISFTSLVRTEFILDIMRYIPSDIETIIENFVNNLNVGSSESLLSIAVLGAIISASTGFRAIMRALNKAYECGESRNFIKKIGISIFFTVILVLIILVVFLALVLGELIGKFLFQFIYLESFFLTAWEYMRYIISFVFMILAFALMYKYSPNIDEGDSIKLTSTLPGAIFASLGWIFLSLIFSFYVSNFGSYSVTYGSLGGVIIMLVWLFISSIVIILGGEINATLKILKQRDFEIDSDRSFVLNLMNKSIKKTKNN